MNDMKTKVLIESLINEEIPLLERVMWNSFGYSSNDNRITGLSLYGKKLSAIPEELWSLEHLRVLSLIHNGFNVLPKEISKLTKLEELYLGGNNIAELPSSIGDIKPLRYLYAYETNIRQIPEEISKLQELKELNTLDSVEIPPKVLELKSKGCAINQIENP